MGSKGLRGEDGCLRVCGCVGVWEVCVWFALGRQSEDKEEKREVKGGKKKKEIEAPAAASCVELILNHCSVGGDWRACRRENRGGAAARV